MVFVYADHLWSVARGGGDAHRLTTGLTTETDPLFSPDGSQIAFSGTQMGNRDVYVMPASGGNPRRLTYHPGDDSVVGWAPDGKRILYRSDSNRGTPVPRLFTIAAVGGPEEELSLPIAQQGCYSPDGVQLAYVPMSQWQPDWKQYRGGQTLPIWLIRLSDLALEKIPRNNSNDFNPMWIGKQIYFLSDRNGATTLFAYDTRTHRVRQVIENKGFDLKSASATTDVIVYEQFGSLHLFDLATQKDHPLTIYLPDSSDDFPEVRSRSVRVGNRIATASPSPTGDSVVCEARGEILTVSEKGEVRNLTNTPGVMERDPTWSPDGAWIAYFSDALGSYHLHLRRPDGTGETVKIPLGNGPADKDCFYYQPIWSPDSQKIVFHDSHLRLWYVDISTRRVVPITANPKPFVPTIAFAPAWSPDSQWITYTQQTHSFVSQLCLYSLRNGKNTPVTDGLSDVHTAVFDRSGKYLYFTASTDFGPTLWTPDMSSLNRPVSRTVYALVLQKGISSPLTPHAETTGGNIDGLPKAPEVKIDLEDIERRIVALPLPARNYLGLQAGKAGTLYLESSGAILFPFAPPTLSVSHFDCATRKEEMFLEGVSTFLLAQNTEKALCRQQGRWRLVSTANPPTADVGTVPTDRMEATSEPPTEWRQMYYETWRYVRDSFYDPGFHKIDLAALEHKYAAFLPGIVSRADLNYLLSEMLSELRSSHISVGGGDIPESSPASERIGLLGADFTVEQGHYRITRIFSGESWNPGLYAPLCQPGSEVCVGEYVFAVEGQTILPTEDIYRYFLGAAGKPIRLRVGPHADGSNSREVTVTPVDDEAGLRRMAWIEENRRRVNQLSGGRLAYIYLPNTHVNGFSRFNRDYFSQVGKEGVIVDARFNGGGFTADYIISILDRAPTATFIPRYGEAIDVPAAIIPGPRALLINAMAGSGGDALAWMFRDAKLGPLIGKRTMGGLREVLSGLTLLDGGSVGVAQLGFGGAKSAEAVENQGVSPDIDMDLEPRAWKGGRDPQLETAVRVVLQSLHKGK